jgi:O-antigen/teichoic acid export membrane protein
MLLVGGGRLAAALLSLISIRAVTTFLTPEQYGVLALLVAIQMFCGLFLINPVGQHINLHTHAWWDEGTLMERLKQYRLYVFSVSIIGGLAVFCMVKQQAIEQLLWTSVAMFAAVVAGTWNATLIPMLNMLGFRDSSVLWSIVTILIGLVCGLIFVMLWPSATAWFAGQAVGMGIGALGARFILSQQAIRVCHAQESCYLIDRRTVLSYCLPLALATGLMWLQLSGYRFLIKDYWGLAQLGFMAVGLQLAGQISALAESLATQFLYPLFYRRVSAHEEHDAVVFAFSDLLNTLVPVYFVLTGLIVLSAPYLLKLLVASQFQDAIAFVMLGAGIELCRVLGNLLSNAAHIRRKTKSLALPYAAGAVTSLILIFLAGLWQWEMLWVGVALISGAVAMFLVMLISMYRQVKFRLDVVRCFIGAAIMLTMMLLVVWMPIVDSWEAAIGCLIGAATLAAAVVVALLWKNPATLRLLNVQLRKN